MRLLLCLLLVSQTALLWAAPTQIKNVRIWAAPDSTRVVFDVSGPVQYQLTKLTDPYRIVIDIKDTVAMSSFGQPSANDKFLQRLRGARRNATDLRVVLDLKKYSRARSFQLKPNKHYGDRLVVDIFTTEAEERVNTDTVDSEVPARHMRDIVIVIDPGHGGEDPGARGQNGTYEKDVVLQLAKVLSNLINRERGMRAVMTRQGDYFVRLRKRLKTARQHNADLFISIHADAFKDPRVHGSSVYVLSKKGASSEHALWLAERENASDLIGGVSLEDKDDVLASVLLDLSQTASLEASIDVAERVLGTLKQVGKVHKRRVEAAGFAVLKSPDIPSILIETAYISNPTEEKNLRNKAHRYKIANSILTGLLSYFDENAPEGTILAARKHIINRGETLSAIAQDYRVSMHQLRALNGLKGDLLQVGQVLSIPNGSSGG